MKKLSQNLNGNRGLTLVEVLIATSIILVFLLALLAVHDLYLKTSYSTGKVVKAAQLAEEGLEVLRFFRDSSWSANIATLSLDTDYYLIFEDGAWQATTTQVLIDTTFERVVKLSAVYRDASANIVSAEGTLDSDTLMIVSSVSWPNGGATTTKSLSTYLTNIVDN